MTEKIAIVGVGKIARDQHIPVLSAGHLFELAATASRHARVSDAEAFTDLATLLDARPDIPAISLATPPHVRYPDARRALLAGRHVMLEKPPGATLSEIHELIALSEARGVTLFATWHSREAAAVQAAKTWLADKTIEKIDIQWKEDVRRWHPGQDWVWTPGGLGVFDPGINALSVLTEIMPRAIHLSAATLSFPENRDTPVAADLTFHDPEGAQITAEFDWLQTGPPAWDIILAAKEGTATLSEGGAKLSIDGEDIDAGPNTEYANLYRRFAELIETGQSDVDLSPMRHVADAFTLGKRATVEPFDW